MNDQCPSCGYPDTHDGQHFKGIYVPGESCDHCQFVDGKFGLSPAFCTVVDDMVAGNSGMSARVLYMVMSNLHVHGLQALHWPQMEYVWRKLKERFE